MMKKIKNFVLLIALSVSMFSCNSGDSYYDRDNFLNRKVGEIYSAMDCKELQMVRTHIFNDETIDDNQKKKIFSSFHEQVKETVKNVLNDGEDVSFFWKNGIAHNEKFEDVLKFGESMGASSSDLKQERKRQKEKRTKIHEKLKDVPTIKEALDKIYAENK